MFAFFPWLLAGPLSGFFVRRPKPSRVEGDLEALLTRMRQRSDPETIPVLASFWLKTVVASGYGYRRWKQVSRLLKRALAEQTLDDFSRQAIIDIQTWIQETIILTGQPPQSLPPRLEGVRVILSFDRLAAYVGRLLNEWLPVEVARLLVSDNASMFPQDGGMPVLAIGRALEGLLLRERVSSGTLEMLLQPELLSPYGVYPADAEMLQDVILSLLGRTSALPPSVMPATLLCVASDAPLPADYRETVRHAFLVPRSGTEEVHVPIAPAQALEILKDEALRIGSVIVTRDGRWWESENLQRGEQNTVVYRPMGRLRLDYSANHLRLRVPWPEARLNWSGGIYFPGTLEIFGREWRVSRWEEDAKRTWLHLVFSRTLPQAETAPGGGSGLRQLWPASVDMAWAALENALTSSIVQRSSEPIERIRHSDLIPLGRAIFELAASLMSRRPQPYEAIETQLEGIRHQATQVSSVYGRVPWRILPAPVRAAFFRIGSYSALLDHLNQVFDSLPEGLTAAASQTPRSSNAPRSNASPHAA